MLLDEREIDLLARFLAKRFPHVDDRRPVLERAGLTDSAADAPVGAWSEIVARAQQVRALARLGRALKVDDPDDVNLREVRHLLVGEPRPGWNVPAAGLGAVAALSVVLVAGGAWALGDHVVKQQLASAPRFEAKETVLNPVTAAAVVEEPAAPVEESVAVQAAAMPVEPGRHLGPDHCVRKGGDVGGWWYVGDVRPGRSGDVITVPHDAYVREELPGTSNGWTRTQVRCVLYAGDRVRLFADPVLVPVGAWWVATTGSDVIVAGGKKVAN